MTTPPHQPDPASVVRAFFAALEDRAVRQAWELADDRIVWRNTSLPTVRGRMVRRVLTALDRDRLGFRADFHHVAVDGDVVLTQRTDHLRLGPLVIDFWVFGTFRVVDGRIVLWHDHFSWGSVLGGTVAGLFRMLRSR